MSIKNLNKAAEPQAFADYVVGLMQTEEHHHHDHGNGGEGSIETLRTDDHEGHRIVIRTTYKIEVDGRVLRVPLGVDNAGNLHCHSLPNYQFASAVEMVKRLIDNFPDDFKPKKASQKSSRGRGTKKSSKAHNGHGSRKRTKKGGK